ncbi:MAG TPA: hypothetical protein VK716_01355 [Terracidiphilus sp.]|nr:hypothetical protein [Terracidiphilus sp.]
MESIQGDVENKLRSSTKMERPTAVTALAFFQFAKSLFLVLVVILALGHSDSHWGSQTFWALSYLASHGGGLPSIFTPLSAAYAAVVGWGLWSLKGWARNLLMATSGLSALRWIRYFSVNAVIGSDLSEMSNRAHFVSTDFQRQTVYALVAIDLIVLGCLTLLPDVPEAFRKKDSVSE